VSPGPGPAAGTQGTQNVTGQPEWHWHPSPMDNLTVPVNAAASGPGAGQPVAVHLTESVTVTRTLCLRTVMLTAAAAVPAFKLNFRVDDQEWFFKNTEQRSSSGKEVLEQSISQRVVRTKKYTLLKYEHFLGSNYRIAASACY
jgi:hypothetical protein